jgi:protein-tyrosine phosphatase
VNSRLLPLEDAVNVRDVGGHRSAFGSEVAPGRVLRGDALSRPTEADVEKLGPATSSSATTWPRRA